MRRLALVLALLMFAPALAGTASGTTGLADPTAMGPLTLTREEYHFGIALVTDPTLVAYAYPVEVRGSVHYPLTGTDLPLVLLLHGRHATCDVLGVELIFTHVCPDLLGATRPIDSYNGYDHIATNLASHGYVVASIDANQINDRDLAGDAGAAARAQLVLTTIAQFKDVDATGSVLPALQGRIDTDRIGLMGHSRGGHGVTAAVDLNRDRGSPHSIDAVFALAPTAFDHPTAAGVAFATLLPYCDGDVSNLQGAWIYDDTRYLAGAGPLYQFLAMGSNHNDYNTRWPSDDWGSFGPTDPHCTRTEAGNGRDTVGEVLEHGLATVAAFLRTHVGGETGFLPYLTGEADWPVPSTLHTSHHPDAAHRVVLDDGTAAWTASGASISRCTAPACPAKDSYGASRQLVVDVPASGSVTTTFAARDLGAMDRLSFRLGVDPAHATTTPPAVTVTLSDGSGASATVAVTDDAVFHPPGDAGAKTVLNMAAVDLAAFAAAGVDLSDVTGLTLGFGGAGRVQLTDVMAQDL